MVLYFGRDRLRPVLGGVGLWFSGQDRSCPSLVVRGFILGGTGSVRSSHLRECLILGHRVAGLEIECALVGSDG